MNGKNSQPDCECGMLDFLWKAKKEVFRHQGVSLCSAGIHFGRMAVISLMVPHERVI
jgi:hypothetical protein